MQRRGLQAVAGSISCTQEYNPLWRGHVNKKCARQWQPGTLLACMHWCPFLSLSLQDQQEQTHHGHPYFHKCSVMFLPVPYLSPPEAGTHLLGFQVLPHVPAVPDPPHHSPGSAHTPCKRTSSSQCAQITRGCAVTGRRPRRAREQAGLVASFETSALTIQNSEGQVDENTCS